MILTCLTGTTATAVRGRYEGCVPLPPACGGCVPQPPPTRLPAYAAAGRQAASAATPAPREQAGTDGRINGCRNPYQGYSDPRRRDRAADQTGRLIADASMLAAWAAARTAERA